MIRIPRPKRTREPTIALINIVFLMLVFFMVAGTLASPLEQGLTLVDTRDLEQRALPDALILMADGSYHFRGMEVGDLANWQGIVAGEPVRIIPDRAARATDLLRLAQELRSAGADKVFIITEAALE